MKQILSLGFILICIMIMLAACDRPGVADIEKTGISTSMLETDSDTGIGTSVSKTDSETVILIDEPFYRIKMHDICTKNGFPLVGETETKLPGISEIILCGKISLAMNGLVMVIVPDDDYFDGYKWPLSGCDLVSFSKNELYDKNGNIYEFKSESELLGRHVMLICDSAVLTSYPGQLTGQRVTVILDDTQQSNDVSNYGEIIRNVCVANGLNYIEEIETDESGVYEILLCGKIEKYMGTVVIVPDDSFFIGYTWPWNGSGCIYLDTRVLYDKNGNIYGYGDISELYGLHVSLICKNIVAVSFPGQLSGQRVTVILD